MVKLVCLYNARSTMYIIAADVGPYQIMVYLFIFILFFIWGGGRSLHLFFLFSLNVTFILTYTYNRSVHVLKLVCLYNAQSTMYIIAAGVGPYQIMV